ncbi:MAG TPA: DNA primase [Solirubrobacteraceae bacterium]|nr:DNA primase [Solirubrobacteraceae bacterium]
MALYTNDSKERVRDAVDMVDLVASRVELKRAGANRLTGLCPFHDERSPSFGINPVEKVYHCFGCQASGDAFTFVMETEGVDFKGALEHLADRYKVTLELEDEDPQAAERRKRRERLLELLERTATYYVRQLWESKEASKARAYLAGRGLQEAVLREFRVGYAPSAWDTVLGASRRAGFGNRELYDAGLAQKSQSSGRIYDRFRSQIIFPLADPRGRVRGFAGRTLGGEGDRRPKYVNSPEGELFHKGKTLFAADLARAAAAKAQSVVAAEGYTDVIAMHQAGVRNAVGIMGTALTEDQIGELARLAPEVKLALDADSAGKEAMLRAARIAAGRKPPLRLRVVGLPPGDDPADLVQREGGEAIARLVDEAVPFARFRVMRRLEAGDLGSAEGRDRVLDDLRTDFSLLEPSAEREELARVAASRLDLSPELLESLLSRAPVRAGPSHVRQPGPAPPSPSAPALGRRDPTERSFLALCIALPDLGGPALAELDPDADLTSDVARRAVAHLRAHLRAPADGLDEVYDGELVALIRELAVRATAMTSASGRDFEIERLQLALGRVGREIAAARAEGAAIHALAQRRSELRARLDHLMEQV